MFKRILIAFTICLLAIGGFTLRNRIEDLQWQLDQTNTQITYGVLSIVRRVSPSVVFIDVVADDYYDDYEYDYKGDWTGSGVIIGPHTVLTAKHVIEDANSLTITTVDGNDYIATNWVVDPNNDCGLLFFEEELGPVAGFVTQIKIGERVIVIGSPYGYDFFNTVTTGIVSGLNREFLFFGEAPVITVDAAGNPGNSGGPVFDMQGRIIGIMVGSKYGADGFGVLISASTCRELYETATEIKSETDKIGA